MFELLQSPWVFLPIALAVAFAMGREQFKRTALFALAGALLSYGLKLLYGVGRVCPEGADCFTALAFPSGHASLAFAVALSFYPTGAFLPFLIYAIFISIYRIVGGLHTFSEVMAGYALALLIFLFFHRGKAFKGGENELLRQSSHIFMGVLFILLFLFAKDLFLLSVFLGSVLLLYYSAYIAGTVPFLRPLERIFERDAPFFGYGALHFLTSMLIMALYIFDEKWALAGMLALTLGDGLSTVVGKYLGRHALFSKTWEGTITFLAVSLAVFHLLGLPLWGAFALTAVELFSKKVGVDDNVAIGISTVALWWAARLL